MEFDHRERPAQQERDNSIIWWAESVYLWLTFVGGLLMYTDLDSSDLISPEQTPAVPSIVPSEVPNSEARIITPLELQPFLRK